MATPTLSVSDIATIIDVTPRHIQTLTKDGILKRARDASGNELRGRYTMLSVRDYIRWQREALKLASPNAAGNVDSVKAALVNRKLAAEAEKAELQLREYKGQLHQSSDVEFVMTNQITYCKQQLLAIPSKIGRLLVGKKFKEIFNLLTDEIARVLRELAGYDPMMFKQQSAARLAAQGVDLSSLNGKDEDSTPSEGSDSSPLASGE